jgi:signal transduction histidine kinase
MDPCMESHRSDAVGSHLSIRHFGQVAVALRVRVQSILDLWRRKTLEEMPDLDRLTIVEFEDSMAGILNAVATAMESNQPISLRALVDQAPLHGLERFLQQFTLDALLTEGRILRSAITTELREQLDRPIQDDEAKALHQLVDLLIEHGILTLIRKRGEMHDTEAHQHSADVLRLADLGTLVAGVAHDAANLMLPLHMSIEHLEQSELSDKAREEVNRIGLIFQQFQNSIVNLRWLSVDAVHHHRFLASLNLTAFARDLQQFHRTMQPRNVVFEWDIPDGLPEVRISAAALSQAMFNLIRNAQQIVLANQEHCRITVRAKAWPDGKVQVSVEDDGPGMTPEVLQLCMQPFFTTRADSEGTGLGLALVKALVYGAGGTVEVHSPPPGKSSGTLFVLTLAQAEQ